jgi:hypothetical protein
MTPLDAVPFHPLHQEALYLNIQQTLIPESCFASELGAKKRNLALKEQGSLTLGVFSPIASSFFGKERSRRQPQRPSLRAIAVVYNVCALGQLWRCAPQRAPLLARSSSVAR